MLRYAITDRKILSPHPLEMLPHLLRLAARWKDDRISFVQLREKDLPSGELLHVASAMLEVFDGSETRLLINGRLDVAAASGAAGVHLTAAAGELTAGQVREWMPGALVSVSCHSLEEVTRAREAGACLILFGPVFEKQVRGEAVAAGTGLELLRQACLHAQEIPVFALGGVTANNAALCEKAGAAGIAGIRLFL